MKDKIMKKEWFVKTLAMGIIVLFIGAGFQPVIVDVAISTKSLKLNIKDKDRFIPKPEPLYDRTLARMGITIGENFSNIYLDFVSHHIYFLGDWHVFLDINFSCPTNRKIDVNIYAYAFLAEKVTHPDVDFIRPYSESFTIINGSNPSNIHIDAVAKVNKATGYQGMLGFKKCYITSYEFVNGTWEQVGTDYIDDLQKLKYFRFWFYRDIDIVNPIILLYNKFPCIALLLKHIIGFQLDNF